MSDDGNINFASPKRAMTCKDYFNTYTESSAKFFRDIRDDFKKFGIEFYNECIPRNATGSFTGIRDHAISFMHVPYLPTLHSPGWLLRYIVGPFDSAWFESLLSDIGAGLTVGLLLIPQGLSYANLANQPPINGLYSAILPATGYAFFGTSMQLSVGPVALASLLTGEIVNHYGATPGTQDAVNVATQAALCVGIILTVMSLFNLGTLIHYIAHPVMSGFTTGAAMIIGLQQLKNAFGFTNSPPQTGMPGIQYNYQVMQWYRDHWNDKTIISSGSGINKISRGMNVRNFIATHFTFAVYFPLMTLKLFQARLKHKLSKQTKATLGFKIFDFVSNIAPFIALIISTHESYLVKKEYPLYYDYKINKNKNKLKTTPMNYYQNSFSIVGFVPPGLDLLKIPQLPYNFGTFFIDCLPLTFVAFMESYAVSHRLATQKNQLDILNASQEMWATGVANLLSSISSSFPVTGSFSRSSLNASSGAQTPLAKVSAILVVITALSTLTESFFYIPNAALAAIIWVAIYNLIKIDEIWHAWKYSKKDFFLMFITFLLQLVFNTEVGLVVGLCCSIAIFLYNMAFDKDLEIYVVQKACDNNGISVIKFQECHFTFINSGRIQNFLLQQTFVEKEINEYTNQNQVIFHQITHTMDKYLRKDLLQPQGLLPKALVIDMSSVRVIDLTALMVLEEVIKETKSKRVSMVFINILPNILPSLKKIGLQNYVVGSLHMDLSPYLKQSVIKTFYENKIDLEDNHPNQRSNSDEISKLGDYDSEICGGNHTNSSDEDENDEMKMNSNHNSGNSNISNISKDVKPLLTPRTEKQNTSNSRNTSRHGGKNDIDIGSENDIL